MKVLLLCIACTFTTVLIAQQKGMRITASPNLPMYVIHANPKFSTKMQTMMDTAQYVDTHIRVDTTSIEYYKAGQYRDSIGIVTVGQAVGLMVVPGRVRKLSLLLNGLNIMRTNSDKVFVIRFKERRGKIVCTTEFISRKKLLRLSKKKDVQVINYI